MMTPAQVADRLSLREFLQLITVVEVCFGKKEKVYSHRHGRDGEYAVSERNLPTKFDVVGIDSSSYRKDVTVSVEGQPDTTFYWDNLRAFPKAEKAAA